MLGAGHWVAGRFPRGSATQPGFALNGLYSPTKSWGDVAGNMIEAKGFPLKKKVFTQQTLGLAYEEKGDAPDFSKTVGRREPFQLGSLAAGRSDAHHAGVDVQKDRLSSGLGLGHRQNVLAGR